MMESLVDWGYGGLFVGSFLASTLIPLSADVLLVGMLALGGNTWICVIIATIGNWLGGATSYYLGRLGRWDWLERWFKVTKDQLEKQKAKIDRFRAWLALFTWLPIVGDIFSVALGFYKINPRTTLFFMFIGRLTGMILLP